ncbi:CHAT domain-containing tetratricopeptide repeat protein [Reyranella sp. CPCC 100927]|uniref:CHAT domain-containing tetratricopeptide repeat protein n=1 Tax=Reyranella sp. CPCC 100927 TaxID=2599616 RepID=UPI0015B4348D|nr:CHAT domain-containing tetratricopeptide repeat protein [Reyranella sp. CPCC 100927]
MKHHRAGGRALTLAMLAMIGAADGGWAQQTPAAPQPAGAPAGQSRAGEACTYKAVGVDQALAARGAYDIFCGKALDPVARVFQLDGAQPVANLGGLAATGPWRSYLDGRAHCNNPTSTTLGSNPAVLLPCARRSGGVPYVGVVTIRGNFTFLGDGLSTAAPAIEATISALGGAGAGAGRGSITDSLGGRFTTGFGSGDIDRYQSLMRVGARHNVEEDYQQAERAYRDALALHQRLFGRDNPDQVDALVHLALNISNQGRFNEAAELYRRAGALVAGVQEPLVKARVRQYTAQNLANQGKRSDARTMLDEAEELYFVSAPDLRPFMARQATRQNQIPAYGFGVRGQQFSDPRGKRGMGQDLASAVTISPAMQLAAQGVAEIYRTRALLALADKQPAQSREYAMRAVTLLEGIGIDPGGIRWRAIRIAGLSAASTKDLGTAGADLGDSARGLSEALPQSQPAGKTFLESGDIQLQRGNSTAALSEFRRGAQILRARRNTVPGDAVLPYLDVLAGRSGVSEGATAAEMFDAAQLISTGVTAAYVAQAAVRLGDGNQKVRELQDLETRLTDLYQRRDIAANRGAELATLQTIDAQITDANQRRDAAEQEVRRILPNYFQLIEGQAAAKDIIGVLRPGEGFLQIVLGPKRSYGFLARDGRVTAYRVALTLDDAADMVAKLRAAFMPDGRGELPAYDVALAHDLYKRLLGPVDGQLKGLNDLVIATNGALQSLPFALLVRTAPPPIADVTDYKKVAWLAKSLAMSYVPAPQSLVLLRRAAAQSRAPNRYIGFGGFAPLPMATAARVVQVTRPNDGTTQSCDRDARELASLPSLPLAEGEVTLAARQLGSGTAATRLGTAFSRSAVTRGGLDQYRVVHFAAHALLPTELRCLRQPVILTGQGNGAEALLTAADVAALRLDADLVVLSACNTAGPDGRSAGEAFSGLARSFFTAGTRGLMASHWNVADETTTLMMVNVLAAIGKGGNPAHVLRETQLDLLSGAGTGQDPARWAHPFYWAPFVFAGSGTRTGT